MAITHDLVKNMTGYLDPHITLKMLAWLEEQGVYTESELQGSRDAFINMTKLNP
jgi:hypothetical protein